MDKQFEQVAQRFVSHLEQEANAIKDDLPEHQVKGDQPAIKNKKRRFRLGKNRHAEELTQGYEKLTRQQKKGLKAKA